MAATNHLFRRGAVYYWRCRLPREIGQVLGRTHLARSLHTAERQRARRLARRLSAMIEDLTCQLFRDAMPGRTPTKADIDRILMDLFTEVLEVGELQRTARPPGYSPWDIDGDASEDEQINQEQGMPDKSLDLWRFYLSHNLLDPVEDCVKQRLSAAGLDRPADNMEWRGFLRKAMATLEAAYALDADREFGIYRPPIHPFVSNAGMPVVEMTRNGMDAAHMTLTEAMEEHIAAQKNEGHWKKGSDTESQSRLAVRLFVAFKSNLPYAQIVKSDAHAFRTWLCGLPALFGRSIYTGLEPQQAIDLRQSIEAIIDTDQNAKTIIVSGKKTPTETARKYAQKLSKTTVNRHLIMLTGLYNRKRNSGVFTKDNPFSGAVFSEKVRKKGASNRKAWTIEDLQKLFSLPPWTGSKTRKDRKNPGECLLDDGRFWIPLIGLFTGAREDEIASLPTDGLIFNREADCWLFDIRAGKTANAPRKVPVHPELLKIGLLEYHQAVRQAGCDKLFPELHGRYRSPGEEISRWFTTCRKDGGIYEEWKDFHSLRRTFKTHLYRELNTHPVMVRQLLGHAQDEMDEAYFGGFEPKDTFPVVQSLTFTPLDLSHLHRENQKARTFQIPSTPVDKAKASTALAKDSKSFQARGIPKPK